MDNIKTQTLIHVATELIVVGGLTVWFNKRISLLQEEIIALQEKNSRCESILEQQGQLLAKHEQIFRHLLGESSSPIPSSKIPPRPPLRGPLLGGGGPLPNRNPQPTNPYPINPKIPQPRIPVPKQEQIIPDISSDKLDELLKSELEVMKTPDSIEIDIIQDLDCKDGQCPIRPRKRRSKKSYQRKRNLLK